MFPYPCNADGKDASALSVASAIAKVRALADVGRTEDNAGTEGGTP